MATHNSLTGTDLHLAFDATGGAAGASATQIAVANGSNGATWQHLPHGSIYFFNSSTPSVVTYPSTYTKVAPTTIAGGMPVEFTEATTARITYTGSQTRHFHIAADVGLDQAAGANRDIQVAIYKSGTIIPNSPKIVTTVSGQKRSIALHADAMLSTNDYLEIFVQNNGVSGDVNIYQMYLFAVGMPGT